MEQASELKNLVLTFYDAVSKGDVSRIESLLSRRDEVLFIGTDPSEWWTGSSSLVQAFKVQIEELGGTMTIVGGDPQAYREGAIGWVADRAKFRLPDGAEVPFRLTAVFRMEEDGWRIIQEHLSIGVPNEQAVGKKLTV